MTKRSRLQASAESESAHDSISLDTLTEISFFSEEEGEKKKELLSGSERA